MESLQIRKIGLIPLDERNKEDRELYMIYVKARDNITGSMLELQKSLDMEPTEFYTRLDSDVKFREAVVQGFTDGRSARILELESSLIRLAVGAVTRETRTGIDADGGQYEATVIKEAPPNLQALSLLLERLKGSTWSVAKEVNLGEDVVAREIDYKMLSKAQLKKLLEGDIKK